MFNNVYHTTLELSCCMCCKLIFFLKAQVPHHTDKANRKDLLTSQVCFLERVPPVAAFFQFLV